MEIRRELERGPLLFDGAMGTMLQRRGLAAGDLPEVFNMTHPDIVREIHREYVEAGADIVSANTFQANECKLHCRWELEEVVQAGVRLARESGARFVALDVGPLGQLMEPMGTVRFEQAYEIFGRQIKAGAEAGADLILIETLSDLYEAKAAVLAAKELTDLPVICTLTFQEDGRTFVGCDAVTASLSLGGLGVDALGVNCSLGPKELMPVVKDMLRYSRVPVAVQANAGLPAIRDGETVYDINPEDFAASALEMADLGVGILGGCCGTAPEFIRLMREALRGRGYRQPAPAPVTACCSGTGTVFLNRGVTVIGERINPTGKPRLKEALRENRMDYLQSEAIDQAEAGAQLLDVNVGLPDLDEPEVLRRAVKEIQAVVSIPLQVDSSDPAAVEAGVRACAGRPIINSVNGKESVMEAIFPIAKKYGALVVCLTLDQQGIPPTAAGRFEIARRIVERAERYGIPREDLLVDCLVLTASAQQDQVLETLRAIQMVKRELGVRTVLGVSNVSFGLPDRESLNATFLAAAFGAGLDAPILNPLSEKYMEVVGAYRVLSGEDKDAREYIESRAAGEQAPPAPQGEQRDLRQIILQGRREEAGPRVREMLRDTAPLTIIDRHFIPALNQVGTRFESGELFLPQLMQSAEAVKRGFAEIKAHVGRTGEKTRAKGRILLATVQGDIHDIGKNIVRMMLENYGYDVLDLGKDVPVEDVVEAIRREDIRLVGLSALMTTTVQSMKKTISKTREAGLPCTFFVGGAVLNEEYADYVGAEHYARDAMESVEIANRFFEDKQL